MARAAAGKQPVPSGCHVPVGATKLTVGLIVPDTDVECRPVGQVVRHDVAEDWPPADAAIVQEDVLLEHHVIEPEALVVEGCCRRKRKTKSSSARAGAQAKQQREARRLAPFASLLPQPPLSRMWYVGYATGLVEQRCISRLQGTRPPLELTHGDCPNVMVPTV